jgi:(1->4)-alpha-D-glucan 1-alpha-D-glucosylmutase
MPAPTSTYRLQLRPEFDFDAAADVATYLADLGVSHAYSSPYLQAAPGSAHGYDVVDHRHVNVELGGEEGHRRFSDALGAAGLGQVLDIVPNHMAITPENAWWTDVLENGPSSRYASYFDVDWDPPEQKLRNTVLMPVLGDHYGKVLEAGELVLDRVGGSFVIRYHDHVFPVAPPTCDLPLAMAAAHSGSDDLAFLASASEALPPATATDRPSLLRRHRDKEVLKRQLDRLCREDPAIAAAVDDAIARINADVDLLDSLLDRQNHRLAHWRTAGSELDYRRFFDVTTLAGLRMEQEHVFADTHELVLGWLRAGVIDGVRIDHPDGLLDPAEYFHRLRAEAPDAWIVVEKILERGEALPSSWPVQGTTGYDAMGVIGGVLVDPAGEGPLTEAWSSSTGQAWDWHELVHDAKHLVIRDVLAADLHRLTQSFVEVCESSRRHRDHPRPTLRDALREVVACFPVYRTYVAAGEVAGPADAKVIDEALSEALVRRPDLDTDVVSLLGQVLRGELQSGPATTLRLRFQQTTGPVMAKSVEDTAFYRGTRLLSLNEVGGDPGVFGTSPEDFHRHWAEAHARWPTAMIASSTHDTKRSEDVRARLHVLSEVPAEAAAALARLASAAEPHRTPQPDGTLLPDRATEWLLLQSLVGAHPLSLDRALAYAEKATREAKVQTSWLDPVPAFDDAVRAYLTGALADPTFTGTLDDVVADLVEPGWVNGLAAQLLKLTVPGVPDVYQGSELWDLSLVDPDNRRPVDYGRRRALLAELATLDADTIWARRAEGLPKLAVTAAALRLRRQAPEVFGPGDAGAYSPLTATGPAADHVVAFSRGGLAVTVVPRLGVARERAGGWRGTTLALPPGRWRDAVSGREVHEPAPALAELLAPVPVALLVAEPLWTDRDRTGTGRTSSEGSSTGESSTGGSSTEGSSTEGSSTVEGVG